MIKSEREQFLQHLALFSDLEAGELRELAEVAQAVQFHASALIFREGEAGDCAYVIVRGSVQVFAIDRNGDEVVLAQLKELDHVGEQSLLPGHAGRRNASLPRVRAHHASPNSKGGVPEDPCATTDTQRSVVCHRTAASPSERDPHEEVGPDMGALHVRERVHQYRHPLRAGDALQDAVHLSLARGHRVSGVLHAHDSCGEPAQRAVRSRHWHRLWIRSAVGDRVAACRASHRHGTRLD